MSSEAPHDPWPTAPPVAAKARLEKPLIPADESGLKPGDQLGSYELLDLLGKGGMGLVFRARHLRLKKEFALKVLSPRLARDPAALRRFERETEALGRLEHPHLVRASDAGVENGTPFVVLELLEGTDLASWSRQRRRWPIAEACEAVRQAALGLQHAYERGLVHRDVKPSNLWLTPAGIVKVLDLGLARLGDEEEGKTPALTAAGAWMGTPDYIAPEQILDSHTADTRADTYSLGCTLFYLLSDEPPFSSATHPTLRRKSEAHLSEPPPDVRQRRPEVPPELCAVLARMLAKRPEARYQTPAEVAAALAPFAQNARLQSLLPGPVSDATAPPTRSPSIASTDPQGWKTEPARSNPSARRWYWAAAAAVLLLAAAGLAMMLTRPEETPTASLPPPTREPVAAAEEKVRAVRLSINHLPIVQNPDAANVGLLGRTSFQTQLGDSVTVEAELSQPAYAFLIAFCPDGTAEVCFPEKDDEPPSLADRLRYPATPGVNYRLARGTGLAAFALVASRQPLPSYRQWRSQCSPSPWGKHAAPAGVVWRANGVDDPVAFAGEESTPQRCQGWQVPNKTPVARLADWLRQAPQVETVAVLGFVVLPRDKH